MAGPLAGLRVLECAQIMAGPTCGALLADLGAEVIKVEKIPGGDDARAYREPRIRGVSAPFLVMNRNKRGIALDFKHPLGRDALLRLVDGADILIENFRPGTLDRLGLGWEALHARRPELIYGSISGYGLTGPLGSQGGFDLVAQAFAGMMSITGEPGRPPAKVGSSVADLNAGLLAASGILAAVIHRLRTGEGQRVDTSLMEAALHQTGWHASVWFATGASPGPLGSSHVLAAPYQAFRTRDRWIVIGGANQTNWMRLCEVLGHPEWTADPRFQDNSARMTHREALVAGIEAVLSEHDAAHWLAALDAAGVPAGPVQNVGEALSHPQTLAREMVVDLPHPAGGQTPALGVPVKFSATPGSVNRPAPSLGEHTCEVLREQGFTESEIEVLLASGAAHQSTDC